MAEKLDEQFTRYSAENFLADIKDESQNQTAELKNIGGQISTENSWLEKNNVEAQNQITELQTISTDIKNIGEQVAEAIYAGLDEKLGTYVDKICAAIEKLGQGAAEGLNNTISKVAGAQMERFSNALDNFSNSIDEKLKNANEISKIMNEQLLKTLQDLDETLKQRAQTSAAEREAEYKKFSTALENLISTLNEVADKIKTNGDAANRQANEDREKYQKQNQETNAQFLATLAGLSKTLQDVAKKIEEQQAGSINNFDALIENLIKKLDKFTDQQKEFLEKVAASNAAQISQAVKNFREIVDAHNKTTQKMFEQVQSQLKETEKFLQQVDTAGNSLKQAAEPVKQSTQQITNNLIETSAQMKTLSAANQTTRETLSDLSFELEEFMENFNGIADELEKSTKVIKDSLENYNSKMNDGMTKNLNDFDKRISDAVSYLREIVEDLSDDLNKRRR